MCFVQHVPKKIGRPDNHLINEVESEVIYYSIFYCTVIGFTLAILCFSKNKLKNSLEVKTSASVQLFRICFVLFSSLASGRKRMPLTREKRHNTLERKSQLKIILQWYVFHFV
jgi:hypothetical protein